MKQVIYLLLLFSYAISLPAQNSFRPTAPVAGSSPSPSDRWDLSKYVWSHTHAIHSQKDKPILDFEAIDQWKTTGPDEDFSISPDAQYFAYSIQSSRTGARDSLIVQATTGSWRQAFPGATPGFFSGDNKLYVFLDKQDLCFLQPGTNHIEKIPDVVAWQQPLYSKGEWIAYQIQQPVATVVLYHLPIRKKYTFENATSYFFDESDTWLACQLNNTAKELVLHHMQTGEQQRFPSVSAYSFAPNGQSMVLQTIEKESSVSKTSLQFVSLTDKTNKSIWSTTDTSTIINSFSLDDAGKQVVFMVQEPGSTVSQTSNSIWYYQADMEKAILKVNQQTAGMDPGFFIGGSPFFSYKGDYIQFGIQARPALLPSPASDAVKIDVWSHKDLILQSTQPWQLKQPASIYACIIQPQSDRVIRLQQPFERLWRVQGDFAVIIKRGQESMSDRFWEEGYYKDSNWLVSLKNGTRTLLKLREGGYTFFSPGGNYLVYFDRNQQCNYFSIHLATGKISNISSGIPAWQLGREKGTQPLGKDAPVGIAAWLEKDLGVLVYDEFYDIWQLDPAGKKPPINITNGVARQQQIRLRLSGHINETPVIGEKDTLLLRALNTQNMQSGFFKKILGDKKPPERLFMGDCMLDPVLVYSKTDKGYYRKVLKAARSNAWIVKRQRADEAPNYQLTNDFKTYKSLTDLQPQKKYNWYTAELHSFKQLDGSISQGILYKPENFDPNKKYPVVIIIYNNYSDNIYKYSNPELLSTTITSGDSPAWLVSHGFLVFTPDIYFSQRQYGPSALNTVEGAKKYLGKFSFVDSNHIGLCAHSFSGRLGMYVLTHSKSFSAFAISEGLGLANLINAALSVDPDKAGTVGSDPLKGLEINFTYGNLWQNKTTWLDQTAVLHADKITSPLLLYCGKKSNPEYQIQATQIFIALRRLEKKAWWLQYEEGGHTVRKPVDKKDFTIRYTQFFDHYLKGAPAPRWMTEGISFELKGIDAKYELDPQGSCGKDCPVCKAHRTSNFKK